MADPPPRRDLRIPLGGLSRHAVRRPRLRRTLLRWPVLAALAGAAAAMAGVLLATGEPQVDVRLDGDGYRIDGQRLEASGGGTYVGPGGAALVIEPGPRGPVAGASAGLDGRHMTGRCEPAPGGESCRFTLGGETLSAVDERTEYGWHRRYSDGRTVAIRLTGERDAPVPFAVGRSAARSRWW